MSSDVVLTSALRSNLQSLQGTQRLIDQTQLRLATGLRVNSALDNPQNFFAAEGLNNRASDLSRLLDGVSQSIRTIQEADTGVTALTSLLDQADSIATSAREELSGSASNEANVTGNTDLRNTTDLTTLTGVTAGDVVRLSALDANGDAVTLSSDTVSISSGDSIEQLITNINDITNTADDSQAFEASLTSDGSLQITNLQGGSARIEFEDNALGADVNLASGLGFGDLNVSETDGTVLAGATNRAGVTFSQTAAIESQTLYETVAGNQQIADASSALNTLVNVGGTGLGFTGDATDDIVISIDGGDLVSLGDTTTTTIQGFVDGVNSNDALNTQIRASFDEDTGRISIEQLDSSVTSIQIGARDTAAGANDAAVGFGFGIETISVTNGAAINVETENLTFGSASSVIAGLEEDYNTVLAQIDTIVEDASFRGVNLLAGDDLNTFFNEDRSSSLQTDGVDFSSTGLNITAANFRNETVSAAAQVEIREAIGTVRAFGNSIANDLAIIQTRRDFTESTINTLEAGADDLTVADQNEEGANLLALQTRQTLGVTSLSLASQSQQAVLRLF